MASSAPSRICFLSGVVSLVLVVVNQTTAASIEPALERAAVLASFLAVSLMLVGVLWTRALPEAAPMVDLIGEQGLELADGLPEALAEELGWGSQMLLTATPAAAVVVMWQNKCLLRRGLLAQVPFEPGPICQRALEKAAPISLVDLNLYPGRAEFDSLLPGLPAVVVQPIDSRGLVVLAGWSPRCFSRSDLTWLEGWSQRLRERIEQGCANQDLVWPEEAGLPEFPPVPLDL
ncbi:MAG: cofactor assembly of complex C subunit B [Cyanobacteria bacterium]|nr:cofactor assembly of complex C subunit B [Cyanobacteriota bacterium]MDA1246141.1 cofactor assembly of complex C subunit B [Cyanobacteriota bacterium]